jgi:hypothetical protein
MREGRQDVNANISTSGITPASTAETGPSPANPASVGGEGMQTAGGSAAGGSAAAGGVEAGRGGSNAPADDPEHIKQVVQEETLHGQE